MFLFFYFQGEYEVVSDASYAHVIDDSSGNIRIIVTEDPRYICLCYGF